MCVCVYACVCVCVCVYTVVYGYTLLTNKQTRHTHTHLHTHAHTHTHSHIHSFLSLYPSLALSSWRAVSHLLLLGSLGCLLLCMVRVLAFKILLEPLATYLGKNIQTL